MSDAALRALGRDTSAAGRRRLVLEQARRAPQGHEAMEALRLLAFLGDEEASAATGQARSAMCLRTILPALALEAGAWGGMDTTTAGTVVTLQGSWPGHWRIGWWLHLAVAEQILPDWCDAPHPDSGVMGVRDARGALQRLPWREANALPLDVTDHRYEMRNRRRCGGPCVSTFRALKALRLFLSTSRGLYAQGVQEVTRAADYNTAACGLTALPEGGLPMPSLTGTPDLWRSFGALLAAGDRSAVTGGLPADQCADGPTAIMRARRRWAAAARRELRREAQRRLVETVGLEWPGRLV